MNAFWNTYYSIVVILMSIFFVFIFVITIIEVIREIIDFTSKKSVEEDEEFREVLFENDLKDYVRKSIGGF